MSFKHDFYFLLLIIVSICGSCKNSAKEDPLAFVPPLFPAEIEVTPRYLDVDFITGEAMDIKLKDTVLLVRSYDGDRFIQVFDKRNGKRLSSMITRGRGPGELLAIQSVYVQKDTIYVYSAMDGSLYKYFSDSSYCASMPDDIVSFGANRTLIYAYPFKNKYLGLSSNTKTRIIVFDEYGIRESEYTKYPDFTDLGYDHPIVLRNLFMGSQRLNIKPDNTKFALTNSRGTTLEIFSLAGDTVSLHKEKRFYPPKVKIIDKNYQLESLPEQISGFWDITSSDNYIYTAFCGDMVKDYSNSAHYVYVFDWDGNPIKSYKIKGGMRRITIDSENRKIYFSAKDAEGGDIFGYFDILE